MAQQQKRLQNQTIDDWKSQRQQVIDKQIIEKKENKKLKQLIKVESRGQVWQRLFSDFQDTNLAQVHYEKIKKGDQGGETAEQKTKKGESLCIVIPLKGGKKPSNGLTLDQEFIKAIQDEYATRYCELMQIEPSLRNKTKLLKKNPLTACQIESGWNSSGWLADEIRIFPNRRQTFEAGRDQFAKNVRENQKGNEEVDWEAKWEFKDEEIDEESLKIKKNLKQKQAHLAEIKSKREQNLEDFEESKKVEQSKKPHFQMNLDPEAFKKKFLYPFALDPAPIRLDAASKQTPGEVYAEKKRQKMMSEESLMQTTKFQFPVTMIKGSQEVMTEIQQPITLTLDEIKQDMYNYAKNFPKDVIPHIKDGGGINDEIHNYKRPKPLPKQNVEGIGSFLEEKKQNNSTVIARPVLTIDQIRKAQKEIQGMNCSKLIGLVAHLAYWNVFGHFNKMPLDLYHRRQIFISYSTLRDQINQKLNGKRSDQIFMIPMLVLALRVEIEVIYKNQYPKFFAEDRNEKIAMKLINDLVTQLLDPCLYFSRFSFFESGREAIQLKQEKAKQSKNTSAYQKFFKRSALVEQLFPNPSDGKVRAIFGTGRQAIMTKTAELLQEATETQKKRTIENNSTRFSPLGSPKSQLPEVPETRFGLRTAAMTGGRNFPMSTTNSRGGTTYNGKRTFESGGAMSGFDVQSSTFEEVELKSRFGFMTARNQSQRNNKTAQNTQKPSSKKEMKIQEEEDPVLNLVNKCQMFQIAATRMNIQSDKRGYKEPIFTLAKGDQDTKLQNFQRFFDVL